MSLFGTVLKLGITAGAVFAVKKVYDRYQEENPEGVEGAEAKKTAYKQAAKNVYEETAADWKEKAPEYTEKVNEAFKNAAAKATEIIRDFAEKAPEYAEKFAAEAEKLANTVGDELSKAFDEHAEPAQEPVDVEATVEDAAAEEAPAAEEV